eukprot:5160594-Pleurochrysis_carterae.AAC.1
MAGTLDRETLVQIIENLDADRNGRVSKVRLSAVMYVDTDVARRCHMPTDASQGQYKTSACAGRSCAGKSTSPAASLLRSHSELIVLCGDEFRLPYMKLFPKMTLAQYDEVWKKIDLNGDGSLSVTELGAYYGFHLSPNGVRGSSQEEMSDEQILEALKVASGPSRMAPTCCA